MDFIKEKREGIYFFVWLWQCFSCFGKIVSGRRWTSVCDFNWNDTCIGD